MANDQRESRLKKLEALRAEGVRPYADRYPTTHTLDAARKEAERKEGVAVRVAGRVMTSRAFGKLTFATLQDASGRCQIGLDVSKVGEASLARFDRLVDLGDFVGVEGDTYKTKKGEPTIRVHEWTFLAKALRPLPEKWHGLTDRETCYRDRHLDLLVNEETRERFRLRTHLIRAVRSYLDSHDFEEVDTPVLASKASGALAKPFFTHHNSLDIDCALRIAPETWLKRCVAGGIDRVYEIARCFRNEGMDPSHLQEFTLLEWYAAYWDYRDNMEFTEGLILHLLDATVRSRKVRFGGAEIDFTPPWPRRAMRDLILDDSGIDIDAHKDAAALRAAIRAKGIALDRDDVDRLERGPLIDVLYKKVSRPRLVSPVFVTSHPIDLSPLARRNDADPRLTDRFQLVVNGWELVNAYSELVDPLDQRSRFEQQMAARAAGDEEAMEIDEDYLATMETGMPPMSGFGMGLDRFLCLLTNQENLRDVVLFPLMKPLASGESGGSGGEGASPPAAPASAPPARDSKAGAPPPPASVRPASGASEVNDEFRALLGGPADDVKDVGVSWDRARAIF